MVTGKHYVIHGEFQNDNLILLGVQMSNITQRHLQKMDVVYYRKGISGCSDIGTLSVPGLT